MSTNLSEREIEKLVCEGEASRAREPGPEEQQTLAVSRTALVESLTPGHNERAR
jgi:hypothetical protein